MPGSAFCRGSRFPLPRSNVRFGSKADIAQSAQPITGRRRVRSLLSHQIAARRWSSAMVISKRNLIAAALLASALQPLLAGPASAQAIHEALPAPARAPAAIVDGFHAALASGDTHAALDFLADDALIFEGGAVERSKSEYAAHHLAADAAFSQAVPGVRHHRSGEAIGEIAWIASEGHTTGTYKDKPVDRLTTETMILKRVGDSWKIVHIHWSSAARKK